MKWKWGLGLLGLFVVIVCVMAIIGRASERNDSKALREQLRLATAEGIPTTWAEFATSIRPAKSAENAAPWYRLLDHPHPDSPEVPKLDSNLFLRPGARSIRDAKEELQAQQSSLASIDRATSRPRCWFDRDWSKGPAVLMPEFVWMKYGARLVALRGSVAVEQGRSSEAIQNIREVFKISQHAGEEGTGLSTLVRQSVFSIGIRHLAFWAFAHPRDSFYRQALADALKAWPKVNLQAMHRDDLLQVRSIVEMSTTEKGRRELGVKSDQVPWIEPLIALISDRSKAEVEIVKAERQLWEAYVLTPDKRLTKLEAAETDLEGALEAYPTASMVFYSLYQSDANIFLVDQILEAHRRCYVALVRALAGNSIARSIKTTDVLSPFDGKPIDYHNDGRQITISVSCPNKEILLAPQKLPNDKELAWAEGRKPLAP